jgi:hypothetical protein
MSSIQQSAAIPTEISGEVLFYSQPEPLSLEAHGKLGVKRLEHPFAFAAVAHSMPLQVSEFGPASLSYPVIFAGDKKGPMAIMGLRLRENLFVAADGRFEESAYVPAFVRRYPFVLAVQDGQDQMIVCIDRAAAMLEEGGDPPLFVDGKLTPFVENAVEFCRSFETERQRSEQFTRQLIELDLFEPKAATFTPRMEDGSTGQTVQLADYFSVSEQKLAALSDANLRDLVASGAMRQIYAHLNSMLNWERLVGRAALRGPLTGYMGAVVGSAA